MTKWAVNFETGNVEYYTPKFVVDYFGSFDYDPATTEKQAKYLGIKEYDTKETDGLLQDWTKYKNIWINPPFDKKHLFFDKAIKTYKASNNNIYFLCPIEFLTTARFYISREQCGVKLYIPNGRIKFQSGVGLKEQTPAFGSVIIKIQDSNDLEFIDLEQAQRQQTLF
jgi:phage N-6-adenine-methyltransferase